MVGDEGGEEQNYEGTEEQMRIVEYDCSRIGRRREQAK